MSTLKDKCLEWRTELKSTELLVRKMHDGIGSLEEENYPGQYEEMKAQATLVVRALEDARLRLGKVIQYSDDGVSIFDKT